MTIAEREDYWAEKLSKYKLSGQTKKAWCAENKIDVKNFYRWGKRLASRGYDEPHERHHFILANGKPEAVKAGEIEIRIGKATINISRGFDSDTLTHVLRVMSNIC